MDRWLLGGIAAFIGGMAMMGWLFMKKPTLPSCEMRIDGDIATYFSKDDGDCIADRLPPNIPPLEGAQTMNRFAALFLALLLSGCGPFVVGTTQRGNHTAERWRLDRLECKDHARIAASTPEAQATGFVMGLTIVGVPAAYAMDRSIQRQTFAKCMTERGYTVAQATD